MEQTKVNKLTPYLCARNAAAAIEFYKKAFGAEQGWRMDSPEGKVMHADLRIGAAEFMISDEFPEYGALSPETAGGVPLNLHLIVADADAVFHQAVAAGAIVERPLENKFYGHRNGGIRDPFGFRWTIGTVLEELTPEQMDERVGIKREVTS